MGHHISNLRLYFSPALWLTVMALVSGGCASRQSAEAYEVQRRAELLTIYPPGSTSREDVRKKWGIDRPQKPPFYNATTRPADGWDEGWFVGQRALNSEKRVGHPIASLERYWGPDTRHFLGLCYVWYYYDEADKLLDVEWQYSTD